MPTRPSLGTKGATRRTSGSELPNGREGGFGFLEGEGIHFDIGGDLWYTHKKKDIYISGKQEEDFILMKLC